MEVLRDPDGSYVFSFSEGEDPEDAEPLSWKKLTAYFMSHIAQFEAGALGMVTVDPADIVAAEKQFTLIEDVDGRDGSLAGYWALRRDSVVCPPSVLGKISMPSSEVDLPPVEVIGDIPLPTKDTPTIPVQAGSAAA